MAASPPAPAVVGRARWSRVSPVLRRGRRRHGVLHLAEPGLTLPSPDSTQATSRWPTSTRPFVRAVGSAPANARALARRASRPSVALRPGRQPSILEQADGTREEGMHGQRPCTCSGRGIGERETRGVACGRGRGRGRKGFEGAVEKGGRRASEEGVGVRRLDLRDPDWRGARSRGQRQCCGLRAGAAGRHGANSQASAMTK